MTRLIDNRTTLEICQAMRAEIAELVAEAHDAQRAGVDVATAARMANRIKRARAEFLRLRVFLSAAERMTLFETGPVTFG